MKGMVCLAMVLVCGGVGAVTAGAAPRRGFVGRVLRAPVSLGRNFLLAAAAQTVAMSADVETTEAALKRQQFSEGNPIFGAHPGRAKLYSVLGGVDVMELFAEHHLKALSDEDPREGRWKWWTVAGVTTGVHATGAIHNAVLLSEHPQQ